MKKQHCGFFISPLAAATASLFAAQALAQPAADHQLNEITVLAYPLPAEGTVIDEQTIEMTPNATSTVTDTLRTQSFVQFDMNSRSGQTGGEITPPKISIRGSRHYENNFTINGISNNNSLNPSGWNSTQSFGVRPSGDAQSLILDTDLLDSITVHSENISAQYGDFTGGLVDAKIRDAQTDRWHGKVFVRHTKDSWARQHYVEGDEPPEHPTSISGKQPQFKRWTGGIVLEGPLHEDKLGGMVSYQKTRSVIPVWSVFGTTYEKRDAVRTNENLLLRLNTAGNDSFSAAGTFLYAPYQAKQIASGVKNGEFSMDGGGMAFQLNTAARLTFGEWTTDFGVSRNEVSRKASSDKMYQWRTTPDGYANWSRATYANEGLMGDYEQEQTEWTLKTALKFNPVDTGILHHDIRTGAEISHVRADASQTGYTAYASPVKNTAVTGSLADGVVSGEQYASMKSVLRADSLNQDYLRAAVFAEDTIRIERFTVRPGVRLSYDDVTHDVNVAPRLFLKADVLNDGRVGIDGGFNRYYGTQILSHALQMSSTLDRYRRTVSGGVLGDWTQSTTAVNTYKDLGNLKTPYSDELTLGASAKLAGDTQIRLQGVSRDYKDQLRTQTSTREGYSAEMTNSGRTQYRGLTLSVDREWDFGKWGQHTTAFGITRSKLKGNSTNWISDWDDPVESALYDPTYVYIDGSRTARDSIPANNFNSDWVITYSHMASFWNNRLRLAGLARWESPADRLVTESYRNSVTVGGVRYQTYTTQKNKAYFNVDLTASVDCFRHGDAVVTLDIEALNLLDRKNLAATSTQSTSNGTYAMGRQFFVSLTARY